MTIIVESIGHGNKKGCLTMVVAKGAKMVRQL